MSLPVTSQAQLLITYLKKDLDVLNPVQCILEAMAVLGIEVILSHQSGLLCLRGVALRSLHTDLSPYPHQ